MNNSRQSLVTQAEKIVDSYSKRINREPKKKGLLLLPALGILIASAIFAAFYLSELL